MTVFNKSMFLRDFDKLSRLCGRVVNLCGELEKVDSVSYNGVDVQQAAAEIGLSKEDIPNSVATVIHRTLSINRDRIISEALDEISSQMQGMLRSLCLESTKLYLASLPHHERVEAELASIENDVATLKPIVNGQPFVSCDAEMRDLLKEQLEIMNLYAGVLRRRIAYFKKKNDPAAKGSVDGN